MAYHLIDNVSLISRFWLSLRQETCQHVVVKSMAEGTRNMLGVFITLSNTYIMIKNQCVMAYHHLMAKYLLKFS